MAKPLNKDELGCNPISSNCVIWQGADIPCINLCKGDTVSDVVYKMVTELCNVLDILNISSYDISCFNLTNCDPTTFQELLQLIIEHICALEGLEPGEGVGTEGCPDCVVDIATCFYYTDAIGDQQTTMQLVDYVTAIGNRLCEIASSIETINSTLASHDLRITELEQSTEEIGAEQGRSSAALQVTPICVLPNEPTTVDIMLQALEQEFCDLIGATGGSGDIYSSIVDQCTGLDGSPQLAGSGNMASIPGWNTGVQNLAEAFSNIWYTMCDVRSAIQNIQANCCPSACDDIDVTLSAALNAPADLRLFFTGFVPANFTECNPTGTVVTIEDTTGGLLTIQVPVLTNLNNATGYAVDLTTTPVNPADDLTITATLCFRDPVTGTECQSVTTYFLSNTSTCPTLTLVPTEDSITYSFPWTGGPAGFIIELFDSSGTVLVASHTTSLGGAGAVINTFTGLTSSTGYKLRVKVTVGTTTTVCPFAAINTLAAPCLPPSGVGAIITL